ncbi:hypothetical protein PV04_09118 [Phialophora macrospora]|uniref:Uncharacterized protein n=1 Tax=Phialophora macrospora TaxID=1851006 RepID=A0A0D2FBE3_9EURO|nr:hypothetical protein PV04_09118 [Phialophora macrospora]
MPNAATHCSIRVTKRDIARLLGEDSRQVAPASHPSVLVDQQSAAFTPKLVGVPPQDAKREQSRKNVKLCVVYLVEGSDIDRTRGAITLTMEFHQLFGRFDVFFEALDNQLHSYRIDSVREDFMRPGDPAYREAYPLSLRKSND